MTDCISTKCYVSMQPREFCRGVISLHLGLISDELLCLTDDELIERANQDDTPDFTLSAERHINVEELTHTKWRDAYLHDRAKHRTHMSLHQVAQMLQHQGSEALAEHAIAMAVDGLQICCILISCCRTNVTVTVPRSNCQPPEDPPVDIESYLEGSLDCAVVYYPIGPSTPRSLEFLACAPIGSANPALLLVTKGPASHWSESESSGREDTDLSSVLRKLAFIAESSLASLSES